MTRARLAWIALGAAAIVAVTLFWRRSADDGSLTATVTRGSIAIQLTVGGTLRPVESITYRSPLGTREAEVVFLAAEGTHVGEGDLLARLDTADLERELAHTLQEQRQTQVELQAAEIDWQTAQGSLESLSGAEGALTVAEAQTRLQAAQKKVDRLKSEVEANDALLKKGFMTKEEVNRAIDDLDQAQADLALEKQRASVLTDQTRPRDEQRARLLLAQKAMQRENVRTKAQEVDARVLTLKNDIEACSIHTRQPGLVVHEEFAGANPRRKIRVGDRVTASQGLVTIPEVNRMRVEASTSEADVHRFQAGQKAEIFLEAFPDLKLTGKVERVGTLASGSADRPLEDKRFDLIVDVDPSDAELRPDMTARVDVTLGTRTGALLVPVGAVFDENGDTVCHLVRGARVESRHVRLAEASGGFVIVLSGLEEGDRVQLSGSHVSGSANTNIATPPRQRNAVSPSGAPLSPK